jgi:hypothetical protein
MKACSNEHCRKDKHVGNAALPKVINGHGKNEEDDDGGYKLRNMHWPGLVTSAESINYSSSYREPRGEMFRVLVVKTFE